MVDAKLRGNTALSPKVSIALHPRTSSNTGSSAPGTAAGSCPLLPLLEDGAGGGPSDGGTTRKHCRGRGRGTNSAYCILHAAAWEHRKTGASTTEGGRHAESGKGGQRTKPGLREGSWYHTGTRNQDEQKKRGGPIKSIQRTNNHHTVQRGVSVSKNTLTDTGILVRALERGTLSLSLPAPRPPPLALCLSPYKKYSTNITVGRQSSTPSLAPKQRNKRRKTTP